MDENNNRNFLLALALSMLVLFAWQIFYAGPQLEQERIRREKLSESKQPTINAPGGAQPGASATTDGSARPREDILKATSRLPIETPALGGSINLKGGRLDDLVLKKYRVTVDPRSPNVVLFSPSGAENAYYAEYGWSADKGSALATPGPDSLWTVEGSGPLKPGQELALRFDNGTGLVFRRTISIDNDYLFTIREEVENKGQAPVTLTPWGLISRHGQPKVEGVWVSHEGFVGVLKDGTLKEVTYSDLEGVGTEKFDETKGWLGLTDKYWAAAIIPDQAETFDARYVRFESPLSYQADYTLKPVTIAPGAKAEHASHLFAGAKNVKLVDAYEAQLKVPLFNRLIDWGWFHVITWPLFYVIDWLNKLFGNFGFAILAVTVLVKILFFPLANKSYAAMSKMKKLQPKMQEIQERYKDDRMRQQQAIMELYKAEKVNPMSGCLPVIVQIPVFFALYKVLYVTLEMRHAPFVGWIQDLSAPDPTSLFNLFGLIPWTPPQFLMLGIWPIIMGITMWLQMKLNPPPPDPVQARIFAWMPLMFTFMLGAFPAGLVIYWAWNNLLSILQQGFIMQRHGVEVKLWDNLKDDIGWLWGRQSSSSKP